MRISNLGVLYVIKAPEGDMVGNWRIRAAIAEQLGPLSCILPPDVIGEVIEPNTNYFYILCIVMSADLISNIAEAASAAVVSSSGSSGCSPKAKRRHCELIHYDFLTCRTKL